MSLWVLDVIKPDSHHVDTPWKVSLCVVLILGEWEALITCMVSSNPTYGVWCELMTALRWGHNNLSFTIRRSTNYMSLAKALRHGGGLPPGREGPDRGGTDCVWGYEGLAALIGDQYHMAASVVRVNTVWPSRRVWNNRWMISSVICCGFRSCLFYFHYSWEESNNAIGDGFCLNWLTLVARF